MIQCPNCKHDIDDTYCRPRICSQCGADLRAARASVSPRNEAAGGETHSPLDTDDGAASGAGDYMDHYTPGSEVPPTGQKPVFHEKTASDGGETQSPLDIDDGIASDAADYREQMEEALEDDGFVDREEFQEIQEAAHSQAISETSLTENEQTFLEQAKAAWADDKLTAEEVRELGQLQAALGISEARVAQLQRMALEAPRTDPGVDADPRAGAHPRLVLEINVNQFYMKGFKGVLDLKLENAGVDDLDAVKVAVSSDLLTQTETWNCQLAAGRATFKKFQVKADEAGIELIQFSITAQTGDHVYAYCAETDVPVFEKTQDLRNISIQADNIVGVGSIAEDAKSMGNAVRGQMESLIRMDKIKNATDLMREYRKMTPSYRGIDLEYDPERSRQPSVTRAKRIVAPARGSLTESASLALNGYGRPVNVLLLAKATVQLGKHRSSDVVTRMLPRSPARDEQSNRMSRRHCLLALTAQGVFITDNQTANGTCLDGEALVAEQQQISRSTRIIELGGVLPLQVSLFQDAAGASGETPYDALVDKCPGELWERAAQSETNALTLCRYDNLGPEDVNGYERYCLIYRWASLGSDHGCSICVTDRGLEPLHAALVYLNSRFYLENLTDRKNVSVNEIALDRDALTPLAFGDRVRIADLDMEFSQQRQVYVDYQG